MCRSRGDLASAAGLFANHRRAPPVTVNAEYDTVPLLVHPTRAGCDSLRGNHMSEEPTLRMVRDLFQGAGFFEQVAGARHNHQLFRASEAPKRVLVQLDHRGVVTPHD